MLPLIRSPQREIDEAYCVLELQVLTDLFPIPLKKSCKNVGFPGFPSFSHLFRCPNSAQMLSWASLRPGNLSQVMCCKKKIKSSSKIFCFIFFSVSKIFFWKKIENFEIFFSKIDDPRFFLIREKNDFSEFFRSKKKKHNFFRSI